jgi:hypothetical protein
LTASSHFISLKNQPAFRVRYGKFFKISFQNTLLFFGDIKENRDTSEMYNIGYNLAVQRPVELGSLLLLTLTCAW